MKQFKYSHTLASLKESGDLKENYMNLNWKLIMSEVIVSHNANHVKIPLHEVIDNVKEAALSYCGYPEELRELLETIR